MIGDITAADKIYIVCGYTDMRRSIDGLCAIVQNELKLDPRTRRCDNERRYARCTYPEIIRFSIISRMDHVSKVCKRHATLGNTGYRVTMIPCDNEGNEITEGDILAQCKTIKIVKVTEVSNHYE